MATSKSKDGGANIRYDEFIKHIRPDASKADPVVVLHGYVGESGSDDKIRLYADESLTEFADILKTDILYAVPDQDNPLGGSRLWIKQSAEVNHTDANAYAQGDMYNSYMGTMYDGGAANMAGAGAAATAACTIAVLTQNLICRNTVFVCPTPVSRLIICNQVTRNVQCQITRTPGCQILTRGGCPQPSWVDACPSALGCTIQNSIACATDITRTIRTVNPVGGGFADAYGSDYAGGDMYNDYMGNTYDGGAANMAGAAASAACTIPVTLNCPASRTICPTPQSRLIICNQVTRQAYCLLTRNIQCQITRGGCPQPSWVDACPSALGCTIQQSIACATDITRTIRTVNPGGFSDAYGADYAGGDMYNDYMGNTYDGGDTMNMAGAAATAACTTPVTFNCPASRTICPTPQSRLIICNQITRQAYCLLTRNIQCQITRGGCPQPSWVDACPSALGCTIQNSIACATDITRTIRTVNPGGFADAYGSDYSGGDMYNDYLQNSYDGGAQQNFGGAGAAGATLTAGCFQVATRTIICNRKSLLILCPISNHVICPISINYRCPITCQYGTLGPIISRNCPSAIDGCPSGFCPDTLLTREIRGGGIQGGGFADAYGADYAGGDMYNDYMANDYSGDANMAGAAAPTLITISPAGCGAVTLNLNCPSRQVINCPTRLPIQCPNTQPNICRTLQPTILICCQPTNFPASRCCITVATRCPATICTLSPVICQRTRICDIGW